LKNQQQPTMPPGGGGEGKV